MLVSVPLVEQWAGTFPGGHRPTRSCPTQRTEDTPTPESHGQLPRGVNFSRVASGVLQIREKTPSTEMQIQALGWSVLEGPARAVVRRCQNLPRLSSGGAGI